MNRDANDKEIVDFFERIKAKDTQEVSAFPDLPKSAKLLGKLKLHPIRIAAAVLFLLSFTIVIYYQVKEQPSTVASPFSYEAESHDLLLEWDSPTDFLIP